MKWFKHLSESTSDPDIMESEIKFKSNGPYVFFRTLEILAKEDAITSPLVMNFKTFKMFFPSVTHKTLKLILGYFQAKNRLQIDYESITNRLHIDYDCENISVYCDKLSTISSDYTKKVQKKTVSVRKTSTLEVEVEVDKEKTTKKGKYKPIDDCPFFNDKDFTPAWNNWGVTRSKKKCSNSDRAIKRCVTKLMELSNGIKIDAIQILDRSADCGWSDLYVLKDKTNNNQPKLFDVNAHRKSIGFEK